MLLDCCQNAVLSQIYLNSIDFQGMKALTTVKSRGAFVVESFENFSVFNTFFANFL